MIKDGGRAFPSEYLYASADGSTTKGYHYGMSLRDYFAGQVIMGLMANPDLEQSLRAMEDAKGINIEIEKYYPELSYEMADAMIKERNK